MNKSALFIVAPENPVGGEGEGRHEGEKNKNKYDLPWRLAKATSTAQET